MLVNHTVSIYDLEEEIRRLKSALKATEYEVNTLRHDRNSLLKQRAQWQDMSKDNSKKLVEHCKMLQTHIDNSRSSVEVESKLMTKIIEAITQKLKIDFPKEKLTSIFLLFDKLKDSSFRLSASFQSSTSNSSNKVISYHSNTSMNFRDSSIYCLIDENISSTRNWCCSRDIN